MQRHADHAGARSSRSGRIAAGLVGLASTLAFSIALVHRDAGPERVAVAETSRPTNAAATAPGLEPSAPAPREVTPAERDPAPSGGAQADPLDAKARRLYDDAYLTQLCNRWTSLHADAAAPASPASPDELAGTGADEACPNRGRSDPAQAELQLQEAARLGHPEARLAVAESAFRMLVAAQARGSPLAANSELVHEVQALATAGSKPAAFLLSDMIGAGLAGPPDATVSAAWAMVAIHPAAPDFDPALAGQYGPYARADAETRARIVATASALFDACCRTR